MRLGNRISTRTGARLILKKLQVLVVILFAALVGGAANRVLAATFVWTNLAGGSFQTGANWTTNGGNTGNAPAGGDATIFTNNASYTVTFSGSTPQMNSNSFNATAGTVTLNIGAGQSWTITNQVTSAGNGGFVIGQAANTTGTVLMIAGSLNVTGITGAADIKIGGNGQGAFTITNGTVYNNTTILGDTATGVGTLTISGPNTVWTNAGQASTFDVGSVSSGNSLTISNGASLYTSSMYNNYNSGCRSNSYNLGGLGASSSITVAGYFQVGNNGGAAFGMLTITNAVVSTGTFNFGGGAGSNNTASVLAGTTWNLTGHRFAADGFFETMTVDSAVITNVGDFIWGNNSSVNTLTLTNGSKLFTGAAGSSTLIWDVGRGAGTYGNVVIVTGNGSTWDAGTRTVLVGDAPTSSNNEIIVTSGGVFTNGSLNIGSTTNNTVMIAGGKIAVSNLLVTTSNSVVFSAGTLNTGGTTIQSGGNGGLAFVVGDGVDAASLELAAGGTGFHSFGSGLVITNNAALRGVGTIIGTATILGTLSPGFSPGTITTSNNVTLISATINYALGSNSDLTAVNGNLTLGGTLNVTDSGGFGTGTYTLFTYTGGLTYNGVTIETVPNANLLYAIDTGTVGQVNLDVSYTAPAGPITGSSSVASGTNGVTYSISSVTNATTYTWSVPSGATIASGQGTTSIAVNFACSATSGSITVTPSNTNGSDAPSSLAVTVAGVGAAGSITGSGAVSAGASGVTYSISSVSGATSYTWNVPSGATIASGQGATSITVNYGCAAVSGSVQVTPSNANGCSGMAGSLPVTVTSVGAAGSISGLSAVCQSQTNVSYSIAGVSGATTYTWTVPTGATIASGQGGTSITVTWGSTSGNVSVTPANASGCAGTGSSLSVTVAAPPCSPSNPPPQTPYPSPTDWRNESIYQILTDRFYDGNPSNDNAEASHGSPYAPTADNGINGGDFHGIEMKLDYIQALGATAIWISPIPLNSGDNSAYHGYHAQDYYTLAPHWGTMTDLSNLVQAAHARGIRVILDIVVNHTAKLLTSTDPGWPNYVAPPGGYHLSYISTANEEAFPFNPTNVSPPLITTLFHTNGNIDAYNYPSGTQEVVLGQLDYLDDLTTETTYVRTNMMNIYTNWVGLADFDAFRVDTAIEVDYGFWQYWCPQLHQYGATIGKSNFFMFGEAFTGNDQYVGSYTGTKGGGPFKFDAMLDYPLYELVNSVFATASGNTEQIQTHYNNIATDYDSNSWYRLVTFLDNHDNPRFLSIGGATTNSLTVGLQFLYTSRGIPCLYYGTEQGFEGDNNNEDNREDMFAGGWQPQVPVTGDNFNETSLLFQQVARLNNFRRLYPALRTGVHNNLASNPNGPGLFAYSRVLSNEEAFVCFNTASSSQTLTNCPTTYTPGTVLVNLLNTNDTIVVTSGSGTNTTPLIAVPSMTTKIYIAQSLVLPLDPVVISQSPSHAAANISTSTSIVLQFSKPMNTNSVQAAFSVTPATCVCTSSASLTVCSVQSASGAPATPGTFTWNALQNTTTFTASGGWPMFTTNLIHLATNAVDSVSGNSFYAAFDTYFVTTSNTVLSCEISGPNAVCANSSSLAYTVLPNMPISSVDWSVSGSGTIIGPTNGASIVVNAGGSGSFTLTATVATTNATNICEQVVTIDPSLLAYWTFDEGSGSIADDYSGNGNTGTIVLGSGGWTRGMVNGALSFDGSATQVTVPNSSSLNPNNGITIAAWVNANNWYNTPRIVEKGFSDNQYALFLNSSGSLEFLLAGVTNGILAASPPSAGAWHHLAGTYDGSLMSLYIDGQLATQQVASGALSITGDPLAIGNKPGSSTPFDFFYGILDDVRVYCGALPPAQIAQLYNIDVVGDGIPDWWRLRWFGSSSSTNSASCSNCCAACDADGTGQNNFFKYVAGLNPTDPTQVFVLNVASVTNLFQAMNLNFNPLALGRTYTPQFSTNLVGGVWLPLTTYMGLLTNGNQVTVTDTNPIPPQEFYRIDISLP